MPITSLRNWFPESEPRVKRRDIAQLIKNLATDQNKDKLEQLILPDLVFLEPEKPKPEVSVGPTSRDRSDGESEEEYYSDENDYYGDDYEEERGNYSSDEDDFNHSSMYTDSRGQIMKTGTIRGKLSSLRERFECVLS